MRELTRATDLVQDEPMHTNTASNTATAADEILAMDWRSTRQHEETRTVTLYKDLKPSDRVEETCGRCLGAGSVSWGSNVSGVVVDERGRQREIPKVCFECNGRGSRSVLVSTIRSRAARSERAARKAAEEAAARVAAREAEEAEKAAEMAAWRAAHADVVEAVEALRGAFGDDLRERLAEAPLTPRQAEAALRIAAEQAAEPTPAPVVEGRIEIVGKILSVRYVENTFGYGGGGAYKARILDDRGFTVYGTLPTSITDPIYAEFYSGDRSPYDDGRDVWTKAARGRRVRLTATVERSHDEETFGFYKRPTKAEILDAES